ncbi:MAG TPA: hypothetical protein VD866_27865 [Urbifossiella sp.]|nr:hypothetical protein [Urbifossiella sp.]
MTDDAPPPSDARALCWVAIFGANVIPPLALVWPRTDRGGQEGLLIGLTVLFALWQFAVPRVEPLRAVLVPGGVAVAASQVFRAPHAAAGAVAFSLVEPDAYSDPARLDQESGFFVAVVYGGLVTLAAAAAGLVPRAVGRRFRRATRSGRPAGHGERATPDE